MDKRIQQRIRQVSRRLQASRFVLLTGLFWILTALIGFCFWITGAVPSQQVATAFLYIAGLASGAAAAAFIIAQSSYRDDEAIARRIERHFPELDQRLMAALNERPNRPTNRPGYLQESVIQQALTHDLHAPWRQVVSSSRTATSWIAAVVGFVMMITLGFASQFDLPVQHTVAALIEQPSPIVTTELTIEPGNADVERGSGLFVTARFPNDSQQTLPSDVQLVTVTQSGEQRAIAMTRTLDEPLFAAHISEVADDFDYRVEFDENKSDQFSVHVFEFPRLVQADVSLEFPEYTSQAARTVEDTLKVTVVEGTQTKWRLTLNKVVESATLTNDSEEIELLADGNEMIVGMEQIAKETSKWKLELVDKDGREIKRPPELTVKVVANRAPLLKLVAARDVRVSPLEELNIAAKVSDDFGIAKYGIAYAIADEPMKDVVIGTDAVAKKPTEITHQVNFEALKAEPDQLLAYNFWAEDHGPDGNIRRTSGDMFFAEVRHFEEIFRQGQQPPGQSAQQQQQQAQSQNAQQAEQLAELQKQIMNATWRIIRREAAPELSDTFSDDVGLLIESQQGATEQLSTILEELQDPESNEFATQALAEMLESSNQLLEANKTESTAPLEIALTHQRLAYQGLLRLRAREHEVVQSQQQQSSSSSSSSSQSRQQFQQQLEQLQLKNDENRYETERQAQQQEDESDREVRQVLNRLKELARRQEDINKQLKDLEAALQAADDEEERERLNRQLKRLRDQQEQMLRDIDELQNRMQESENQQAMQSAEAQVQQSRENAREATEAMEQNDPSRALTAGTRAEQDLKDVRDRLRQETANQFEDAVREMRNQAQQLDEAQREINRQIADDAANTPERTPGLRSEATNPNQQTTAQLTEQRTKLEQLLKEMQETVTEAESSEPLLSQKLYDAIRDTYRRRLPEQLDTTEELIKRGMRSQAEQLSESTGEGLAQLREDVEEAAQSVLGDETEGLRRALTEIDRVAEQLQGEIDRNTASQEDNGGRNESSQQESRQTSQPARDSQQAQQSESEQDSNGSDGLQPADQRGSQPSSDQSPEQTSQQKQQGGQQSNSQPSETPSTESETSQSQSQQNGQQPGQQSGQQQQSQPSDNQQPSDNVSQQPTSPSSRPDNQQEGQQPQSGQSSGRNGNPQPQSNRMSGGGGALDRFAEDAAAASPITGSDFREWSDRLRDVEEMIEDPKLRAEAAGIRDRARGFRQEYTRQSEEPQWDLVRELVAVPLEELRVKVSQELMRRSAKRNEVVPIDRDPVPKQFTRQVEEYYEQLGLGTEQGTEQ